MKKLTKNETNDAYNKIRKVAWHLANDVVGVSSEESNRKNQYFKIERHLKRAFLEYDREKKLAKSLQDLSKLDTYLKAKTFPKTLFSVPKVAKKSTAKTKRV
tara:strand:+ start:859 stop:1164 length:306 start_codon:yes stop_codon:yes gene_type:complete